MSDHQRYNDEVIGDDVDTVSDILRDIQSLLEELLKLEQDRRRDNPALNPPQPTWDPDEFSDDDDGDPPLAEKPENWIGGTD